MKEKMNALHLAKAEKLEGERQATISRLLSNTSDDGRHGRAFEVSCARVLSNKTSVSAQGRVDVSIKMTVNGSVKYVSAECKTNGGRVDDLLNGSNKAKFVIYRLSFVQKHKATAKKPAHNEIREIPAIIIPTEMFLSMLKQCNALKSIAHGGVVDGTAIQPSSKKMFLRLQEYIDNYGGSVLFDRNACYDMAEFDGLEL